jgi:HEAT repeat protein
MGIFLSKGNINMEKKSDKDTKEKANLPLEKIKSLIATFSCKDGWKRKKANSTLVDIGKPAVPFLLKAMKHPKAQIRWEAAKALGAISDPRSGPDIVNALTDEKFEIRWLAAEALIALRLSAIEPLLKAMIDRPESWELRQGAHHVLHALEQNRLLNKSCINLLNKLRGLDQGLSVPLAAKTALRTLSKSDK